MDNLVRQSNQISVYLNGFLFCFAHVFEWFWWCRSGSSTSTDTTYISRHQGFGGVCRCLAVRTQPKRPSSRKEAGTETQKSQKKTTKPMMVQAKGLTKVVVPSTLIPNPSPGNLQSTRLALHVCALNLSSVCAQPLTPSLSLSVFVSKSTDSCLLQVSEDGSSCWVYVASGCHVYKLQVFASEWGPTGCK